MKKRKLRSQVVTKENGLTYIEGKNGVLYKAQKVTIMEPIMEKYNDNGVTKWRKIGEKPLECQFIEPKNKLIQRYEKSKSKTRNTQTKTRTTS